MNTCNQIPLEEWIYRNKQVSYVFNFCPNQENPYHRCSLYCLRRYGDRTKPVVIQPLPPVINDNQ